MGARTTTITLADNIYHYLWNQIAFLKIEPGTKLSEAGLARQFNCSRIPVREAVKRLVAEGALLVESQRGSFVTRINLENLEKVRYLREVLETKIILDDFDKGILEPLLPILHSMVARQEELINLGDYEQVFSLDTDFHRLFYSIDHKEFVLEYTGGSDINYLRARLLTLKSEAKTTMIEQHREIVSAIEQKNRANLEAALIKHFNNVTNTINYHDWISDKKSNYFI